MARLLSRLRRNQAGSVAILFALVLPVAIGGVAAAVDYGRLAHRRAQLQNAADSGALAAARELSLAAHTKDGTAEQARALIRASG